MAVHAERTTTKLYVITTTATDLRKKYSSTYLNSQHINAIRSKHLQRKYVQNNINAHWLEHNYILKKFNFKYKNVNVLPKRHTFFPGCIFNATVQLV